MSTHQVGPATLAAEYAAAFAAAPPSRPRGPVVVLGVSTDDLGEGRGDPFVALGLGRALQRLGYEVVYRGPERWYDVPEATALFVALVAEPTAQVDPLSLPSTCRTIAWVRNNTQRWVSSATLGLFDGVLASSELTLQALRRVHPGPIDILRIGVDTALFQPPADDVARSIVAVTVNQWGGVRDVFRLLGEAQLEAPLEIHGVQRGLPRRLRMAARGPAEFFALPAIYRRAVAVLDDVQGVNRGFGNVNSRVYEAIAAGALPITNSALGLAEVGLDGLPVYRDVASLSAVVERVVRDHAWRDELVARLRAVVVEQHSYDQRAREFDAFVRGTDLLARADRGPRTIAFFPDYRHTNPYQSMLYARTSDAGIATVPAGSGSELAAVAARRGRRAVVHVHWTAPVLGRAADHDDALRRARAFDAALASARRAGARIVWTVHNAMPHDPTHPDLERWLRQRIVEHAHIVHVMCEQTLAATADEYDIPRAKVRVIRHGSYVGVYPDVVDRETAREILDLPWGGRVLLFLGQIRPYKGIDRLLDSFARLRRERQGVTLVVAGAPTRAAADVQLAERVQRADGVRARIGTVSDADIQVFLAACDLVVLPYERVLNSGAALLALSAGRPIVAPSAGCVSDLRDCGAALLFDPAVDDLAPVLVHALDGLVGPTAERAAAAAAREFTAHDMAREFVDLIDDLVPAAPPSRVSSPGASGAPRVHSARSITQDGSA